MKQQWFEKGRWRVTLAQILYEGYGRKQGKYVYLVSYGDTVVYVGSTRRTMHKRLTEHMKQPSNLGVCLNKAMPLPVWWFVEVISIGGNLDMAELHYIWKHQPPLNKKDNNRSAIAVSSVHKFFRVKKPTNNHWRNRPFKL